LKGQDHSIDGPVAKTVRSEGTILIFGLLYIMVNLVVDMIYAFIDPRIRYD